MFYLIGWVLAGANGGFAVYNIEHGDYAMGLFNALSMLVVLNSMRQQCILDTILKG